MSTSFRQYLLEAYESRRINQLPKKLSRDIPIQIDDQDDNDSLTEFCNIFVIVKSAKKFQISLCGKFPITEQMADLAEIYGGTADSQSGRLTFELYFHQINVLVDLAKCIRKSAMMGPLVNNPRWYRISARTISSIHRFIRIIRDYSGHNRMRESQIKSSQGIETAQ